MNKVKAVVLLLAACAATVCRADVVGSMVKVVNGSPDTIQVVDTTGDKSKWLRHTLLPGQSAIGWGFNSMFYVRSR